MALLDPTNHDTGSHRAGDHQPTTKPILCLLSGFAFLVATAVGFHFVFNALF